MSVSSSDPLDLPTDGAVAEGKGFSVHLVNFEGPFIYLMFGQHTLFIQDTGATADARQFPLYESVRKIMRQRGAEKLKILVTHSHGSRHRVDEGIRVGAWAAVYVGG